MPAGAAKLREMLASGRTIISPGVYDGLGARVCLQNGFDTLYMVRVTQQGRERREQNLARYKCFCLLEQNAS